jgi:hypothetical protein
MAIESTADSIERTRARLRQSRAEIFELACALRGGRRHADDAFPRSAIMQLATGRAGRMFAGGALLSLAVLRPGLLPLLGRLIPWAPLVSVLRSVLNRYLVRRNVG